MISVVRFKRVTAAALAVVAVLVGLVVVRQLGGAIVRSATGADPTSIFNDIPPAPAEVRESLSWLPDPERDGRAMEPRTRVAITDAYARAIAAIDRAGRGDDDAPLGDYLSGSALDAATSLQDGGASVATISVRQDLRLDFYSDDGSVVAVGVPRAEIVRVVDTADGARTVDPTVESWRFVMLLEDGNWRVQQIESVDTVRPEPFGPPRPLDRLPVGANALSAQSGDRTWTEFDPDVAAADLERVVDLGLDTVRVFVAGPEFPPADVAAIGAFLDLAADRGVDVVVTLFDGSADHSADGWIDDEPYVTSIVEGLSGHQALVLWDLKNEPDLDDERSGGAEIVDAWLERTARLVRRLDPEVPVTVGWSSARHATRVIDSVDVVSFHHFEDAERLRTALSELAPRVGDRQVVVSEYGRPAWVGFVRGAQPTAQARAIVDLRAAADGADAGSLVWQLRDTDAVVEPGVVAGRASRSYGLFEADGRPRPAATALETGTVPGAGLVERARSFLPMLVPVLILAGAIGWWWRRRRVRTTHAATT